MNVRFLTLAQQEVDEAVVWFDERVAGKGIDFLDELDRVVRLVKAYPFAGTEIEPEIRRWLFARFSLLIDLWNRWVNYRGHRGSPLTSRPALLGEPF